MLSDVYQFFSQEWSRPFFELETKRTRRQGQPEAVNKPGDKAQAYNQGSQESTFTLQLFQVFPKFMT